MDLEYLIRVQAFRVKGLAQSRVSILWISKVVWASIPLYRYLGPLHPEP